MKPDLGRLLGAIWFDRPEIVAPLLSLAGDWRERLRPIRDGRSHVASHPENEALRHARALALARELDDTLRALGWTFPIGEFEARREQRIRGRVALGELTELLEASHAAWQQCARRVPPPRRGPRRKIEPRLELLRALDDLLGPLGVAVTMHRGGRFVRTYASVLAAAGVKVADPLNDIRAYLRRV